MTDERILEIAKQHRSFTTFACGKPEVCPDDDTCCHYNEQEGRGFTNANFIDFARAIAAAQREEDAKICLEMQQGWASDDHIECAAAIRKGGE